MQITNSTPHKKARIEIIPLIDIMFFLLASFMLVSMSMIKLQSVATVLPDARTGDKVGKPGFTTIGVDKNGNIFFDKDKDASPLGQLTSRLQPLVAEKGDKLEVFINADKSIKYDMLVSVLDQIRNAGVKKVSFPVTKPTGHAAAPVQP